LSERHPSHTLALPADVDNPILTRIETVTYLHHIEQIHPASMTIGRNIDQDPTVSGKGIIGWMAYVRDVEMKNISFRSPSNNLDSLLRWRCCRRKSICAAE
jgi:hypothetical protein